MTAKVLIVEDDNLSALDLKHEVERLGYQVVGLAESADEALFASEDNRPDLVLMDINIVGSMDGIQTARMLYDAHRVPVVFLTSACDELTITRATKAPLYGYLVKPFRRNELKATIQVALHMASVDAAMESAHQTLATTVGSLPDGVFTVTLDHRVQFMNAVAEEMTGFELSQVKGKKLFDVLNLLDSRLHTLPELDNEAGALVMEDFGCSLSRKDAAAILVDLAVSPLTDPSGQRTGFVVTVRNAAERLRSQAVEEILDEVHPFDMAPMPMVQLDADGYILRVNKAMLHESGINSSVIVGRSLSGLSMDPDPRIARDLFHKLLQADTSVTNVGAGKMN